MELNKRLSALFLALVMLLSVSVSAFATDAEYIGEETLAEIHEITKDIDYLRLPIDGQTRYFYKSGSVTYGLSDGTSYSLASGSYTISPGANDSTFSKYPIQSHSVSGNGVSFFIQVSNGTYYDFTVPVSYSPDEYDKLTVGGSVVSYLYCTTNYSSSFYGRVFPNTVQLLVNGSPVGDVFSHGSTGGTLDVEFDIEDEITSLGYRFTFTANNSGNSGGTRYPTIMSLNLYVGDEGVFEFASPPQEDPNTGFLQSILQWIIGIYNSVFVPDSQKDDANNFQSEVSDTVAGADEVKDELDQLEKPNPEDIDTDLSDIITDDAYAQQTQIFADLLRFDKITDMLMIVFTMALISYVLFGKKG